jgi:phosphoribosylaminoimidazole-succinocarboxamide synthase
VPPVTIQDSPVQLDGLTHLRSGKVRDLYDLDDEHLLLVASDRVSTSRIRGVC